jgi:hypothetical protein
VVLENADRGFLDFQRQVSHRSVVWSLMKRNSHVCRRIGMVCKTVAVIAPYPRTGGHHVFQRRQNGTALRSGNPRRGSRPSDPGKTRLQWCLATSSIRSPIKSPRPWARQRLAGAIEVRLASQAWPLRLPSTVEKSHKGQRVALNWALLSCRRVYRTITSPIFGTASP